MRREGEGRRSASLLPLLLLALLCRQASAEYGIDAKVASARAWLPERLHLAKVHVDDRPLQQVRQVPAPPLAASAASCPQAHAGIATRRRRRQPTAATARR